MLGNGPLVLGNGQHVLGNGPLVLGKGPHLCTLFMNRVILIMSRYRLGRFVYLAPIGLGNGPQSHELGNGPQMLG